MGRSFGAKQHSLVVYFLLAYAITWILSIVATTPGMPQPIVGLSALILHYGPALAALIVTAWIAGRKGVGTLLNRLRIWRVGIGWYLLVLLYPVVSKLMAVGIDVLLGGTAPAFFSASDVPASASPLVLLLPVFIGTLLQAGLAEEIGWRGFAQPQLQSRFNALISSLILGVLWAFWHFHPLNWAMLAPVAPQYVLMVICFTILLTWVYNSTKGSLLLVVLFHAASNTSDWIVPITPVFNPTSSASMIQLVLYVAVAVVVVLVYGPKRLSREPALDAA
jgi:CAAX protease family protein